MQGGAASWSCPRPCPAMRVKVPMHASRHGSPGAARRTVQAVRAVESRLLQREGVPARLILCFAAAHASRAQPRLHIGQEAKDAVLHL